MSQDGWGVILDHRVEKDLLRLPVEVATALHRAIPRLSENPVRPRPGLDIKRLRGSTLFRLRLGQYRVLYALVESRREVWITGIFHRATAYRR
jgi:mRNA interferase RelE/StbE